MATPRSNWFKVADSVAFESWSNDVAATFIRLGAYMNTRWARDGKRSEDRGRVVLSSAVLQQLTGTQSLARARRVLHELAMSITLVIDEQGTDTSCEWPKYAKFQEMGSRESPLPISKPSQANTKKEEKILGAPSAPPAERAKRARSKTLCPDALSPEEQIGILRWASAEGFTSTDVQREWEAMRDHWGSRREMRADWPATFRTWLRNAKRFAARDAQRNLALSPAQAKAERTKDAGRKAYEMYMADKQQRTLRAIEGGQ